MRIPSGVTDQYIYFVAVDATDFATRETGLSSFTVYRSRDGGIAAAFTTPTINETDTTNMPGVYELLLDEDMTIGAGNDSEEMVFHITHAGMAPVTRTIELYRPKITAGDTLVTSSGAVSNVTLTATTTTLTGHTAQTGDSYARLGAPAGASVSADIAALPTAAEIEDEVWDADRTLHQTTGTMGWQNYINKVYIDATYTLASGSTGFTAIDTVVDAILVDTGEIGTAGAGLTNLGGSGNDWNTVVPDAAGTAPTATENADALLNRDMSSVSDTNARSPLNALRFLRNKWSVAGTTLTVTEEDDTTAAWTATVTTDASAAPITGNDPA